MILNPREDSLTSISLFFFLWGVVKDCTSKEKRWNQTFGKQAMTYDAILKQAWGNYLIIAFINNQFLTSICFSTSFITSKDTARPLGKTAGTEGTHGKKRSKMTIISDILRQNPCRQGYSDHARGNVAAKKNYARGRGRKYPPFSRAT